MNISNLRLASHQLGETSIKTAKDMVAWFGAIQGQEYAQTKWGLGLRLPHLSDTEIEQELSDGKILRTHILRPTWHFVTSDDIGWLLELTAPRVMAANAYMYRKLELDNPVFNKCNKIIEKLLEENKQLTRDEINIAFKQNKIYAEGHRLSYIMMHAELEGIICSGARRGNQFTYKLLVDRVNKSKLFNKEEALARLTKLYFQSRGPATVKDFSTWSGLTLAACKQGIDMIKPKLEKKTWGSSDYYFLQKTGLRNKPSIHLLPIYDEYIMGYKDRTAILEFKKNLKQNPPFHFDCMMIYDGQIIGTWKRTVNKKQIHLDYNLFKPLTNIQKGAFDNSIKRFEEFNKMPVHIEELRTTNR